MTHNTENLGEWSWGRGHIIYILCCESVMIVAISPNIDSEDSERVDPFLSGRYASVEEATGLSSGVSQQLIYGQCTNRLDLRSKPECKWSGLVACPGLYSTKL